MSRFASRAGGPKAASRTIAKTTITLAVALLAAGVASLSATPVAAAGTYKVSVCKTPSGKPVPLDTATWKPAIDRVFSAAAENCSIGHAIALFMGSPGAPSTYNQGRAAAWSANFSAMRLRELSARRSVSTTSIAGDTAATPEYRFETKGYPNGTIESCAVAYGCVGRGEERLGDDARNAEVWGFANDAYGLEAYVHCGGSGYCVNGGRERIIAAFYRMALKLEDVAPPGLQYETTPIGNLTSTGPQDGIRSFRFFARDYESGLYEAVVSIDGKPVSRESPDTNGGKCVDAGEFPGPDFLVVRPCSTANLQMALQVDTTKVSDGKHQVTVDLVDAAGNAKRIFDQDITVENVPAPRNLSKPTIVGVINEPRPSDKLTATPGVWDGSGAPFTLSYRWQRSPDNGVSWADIPNATGPEYVVTKDDIESRIRVRVAAASSEGTTFADAEATGIAKSGLIVTGRDGPTAPAPDGSDSGNAQLVVDREQRTVEVKYGAKIVITGRLVDADGQPIANAEVDVFEQLVLTAAPWAKIGSVRTDSQGGYVYRPATTASRRLRFAFADRRDASNYRAMREVLVSVEAAMTIKAKRRVVSPRGVIRLKGRLTIESLPKGGTWVEVQVLDAGSWRTVATRRTSSRGLWTFNHRLRQSSGITFKFRSRLRVVGDVPSAEAKSAPVKVRVR